MTTTYTNTIREGYEPIPGYVLEEVLGRGGFGEVWRCSAPGGLKKAIKFVFGNQDQSRAMREMRSLERIKGVHHPFLLTLERFEIVDDQLVIVTELADGSLEDVYNRYRESGSCGIPREILLRHLHDSADGLDYLHQSYQLQHLDIKPGNLLMIGGHVKVADFGLLKDLRDIDCSVVGGLTPIYAPPELFDGRPSLHSDQYSLAVMFQEMLTGTRPFSGRTIAQLATQHVHSAPNLEPLPPGDRPVMARALEKNPDRRFKSCVAFVEALRDQRGRSVTMSCPSNAYGQESSDTHTDEGTKVEDLPQLVSDNSADQSANVSHAMVIGLGGSGAECVRELRRRIADLHVESPVKLNCVVIDSDIQTIHSLRLGEVSDRVPKCGLIYTPLRTASEYRNSGTERLRSISRRWIYNVPRSGCTEGMRPLGRLALVDHGEMVQQKLAEAIKMLAESTALPDGSHVSPHIYVVGSLSGGTASGMYIDVVHLLRSLLDEAGFEGIDILSLLSSATFQADPSNPLALHDVQAALCEIDYFMQVGNGYPGDPGAQWPSVPAARTPLKNVYLMAAAPRDHFAPSPVEAMLEYIWADTTGCGDLLSEARRLQTDENTMKPQQVRTVGVVSLGARHRFETKVLTPALVRDLLTSWLGVPSQARQAAPALAERMERRLALNTKTAVENIREHIRRDVPPAPTMDAADTWVAQRIERGDDDWLSAGWLNSIYREVSVCLNDRRCDLSTIVAAFRLMQDRCVASSQQLMDDTQPSTDDDFDSAKADPLDEVLSKRIAASQLASFATQLQSLNERLERFAAILAIAIVESKNEAGNVNPWETMPPPIRDRYASLVTDLHNSTVAEMLVRPINDLGSNVHARSMINELTERAVPQVVDVVESYSQEVAARTTNVVSRPGTDLDTTAAADYLATHTNLRSSFDRTKTLPSNVGGRFDDGPLSIPDAITAVKPALLALGGLQRLLLVVGSEVERSQLEPEVRAVHAGALTVAVISGSDPKLIHEGQGIELKNILSRLAVLNGGNEQITCRLASRVDVAF
jgi:eukaryotic-like serine/threonine-protein kinase